jgi:AcrR family transcriptional regulator
MVARRDAVNETRERILQAAFDLWREHPYDDVTLDMVASAAEVSRQTVHRQFGSKDELAMAVTSFVGARIDQNVQAIDPGDIRSGVKHQVDVYERMGDLNVRMVQLEGRVEAFDHALNRGRAAHRAWIERVFEPHLPHGNKARELAVMALYAATDVMVWKLLRRDFGMPRGDAEATMLRLVEGVIATMPGHPGDQKGTQ